MDFPEGFNMKAPGDLDFPFGAFWGRLRNS